MVIFIKNMVSLRCKIMVTLEFERLGIAYKSVELGEVQLAEPITDAKRQLLEEALKKMGLELLYNTKDILIEKIINTIIETIHYSDTLPDTNFSTLLSEKLHKNYHYLAELFSKTKGTTIERFIIRHKIERVKKLIIFEDLSLTEISYKMHYSSVAHLSNQFKKVTGLTPSFFKTISDNKLSSLDDI